MCVLYFYIIIERKFNIMKCERDIKQKVLFNYGK